MLVKTLDGQPINGQGAPDLPSDPVSDPMPKSKIRISKKIVTIPVVILLVLGLVGYLILYLPARKIMASVQQLEASARGLSPLVQ